MIRADFSLFAERHNRLINPMSCCVPFLRIALSHPFLDKAC
jgi:hypothetical protein